MFVPNQTCSHIAKSGLRTRHGEPIFLDAVTVPCAVVRLEPSVQHTSVRADSSGSRANAEEVATNATILFPAYVTVQNDDVIEIAGYRLEVKTVHPRFHVTGILDHYEIKAGSKEV